MERFWSVKWSFVLVLLSCVSLLSSAFALTSKEQKWVKVLRSASLEYESPGWFTPFTLDEAPEDIAYWTSILPYPEDRNEDMYLVLPTLWLIVPVVGVPRDTQDFENMVGGKEININKYLIEGVMHYPNTGIPGQVWNPVIFGHSNFFKNGEGKYKTIFADVMALDPDITDEMWIYLKQPSGEYELLKFSIEKSYETSPTDVGILKPQGGKELTVFGCTNGLEGRWILRGKLIENDEVLVPYTIKFRFMDLIDQLETKSPERRKEIIVAVMEKIEEIISRIPTSGVSYHDKFKKYILHFFTVKLSLSY